MSDADATHQSEPKPNLWLDVEQVQNYWQLLPANHARREEQAGLQYTINHAIEMHHTYDD